MLVDLLHQPGPSGLGRSDIDVKGGDGGDGGRWGSSPHLLGYRLGGGNYVQLARKEGDGEAL